jgi:hypothetical protein
MRRNITRAGRCAIALAAAGMATALTVAAAPAFASQVHTTDSPDKITVQLVQMNGSGCKKGSGTAHAYAKPDRSGFFVYFDKYTVNSGDAAPPTDARRNCVLSVLVKHPQGFTYSIAEAHYFGIADLQDGATGSEIANYWFQGDQETLKQVHPVQSDHWHFVDKTEPEAQVFERCNQSRILNINTELRVKAQNPSDPTSTVSMLGTYDNVNTLFSFSWKKC